MQQELSNQLQMLLNSVKLHVLIRTKTTFAPN